MGTMLGQCCCGHGFAVGAAVKSWHGSQGHLLAGEDHMTCATTAAVGPQIKYRSRKVTVEMDWSENSNTTMTPGDPFSYSEDHTFSGVREWTVDKLGLNQLTSCTTDYTDACIQDGEPVTCSVNALMVAANLWAAGWSNCGGIQFPALPNSFWSDALAGATDPASLEAAMTFSRTERATQTFYDPATGTTCTETGSGTTASTCSITLTKTLLQIVWHYSIEFSGSGTCSNGASSSSVYSHEENVTLKIEFGTAYTNEDVIADADELLAMHGFCSMALRTDEYCQEVPVKLWNEAVPTEPNSCVFSLDDEVGQYGGEVADDPELAWGAVRSLGMSGRPRGAYTQYNLQGETTWPGRVIRQFWREAIEGETPSHKWARPCAPDDPGLLPVCEGEWNTTVHRGNYVIRQWFHDYRDITLTPSLRPNTLDLKNVECSTYVTTKGVVGIAPAACGPEHCTDHYWMPGDLELDRLGTYWHMDVAQIMHDPLATGAIVWSAYPSATAVQNAIHEEAVCVKPTGAPDLRYTPRVLNCENFVAEINNDINTDDVNPECVEPQLCGEAGDYDSIPWAVEVDP